jgi:hypothetical protein
MLKWAILAIWAIGSLGKLGKMGEMGNLEIIFEYFGKFWNHSGDSRMGHGSQDEPGDPLPDYSGDSRIAQAMPCRIILEILSRVPLNTCDDFRKILFKFALTQSDLRYSLIVSGS